MAAAKAAADVRDRPLLNANFLVEFGTGKGGGFAEVIFAPFAIPAGALDLYDWWNQARRGQAPPRRVVKVRLLGEDHATVLMTWRFRNVRPVSLAYSPLNALENAVLMETIELTFDGVEML
jgi:hypothetical protein